MGQVQDGQACVPPSGIGDTVPLDFGNLGTDVSPLLPWAHDLDPGRAVHSCYQEVAEPSG